ncbi:MAG: Maf family protein [Cyanobacteria bacterium P01_H01_bin.74]
MHSLQENDTDTAPKRSITKHRLVLASVSPRRQQLLSSLGLEFSVIPSKVDESAYALSHLSPEALVGFLSRLKAQEVYKHQPGSIVIGADTVVVFNHTVLGKPTDKAHAIEMLTKLQGNQHQVLTGISIFYPPAFYQETGQESSLTGQNQTAATFEDPGFLQSVTETTVTMAAMSTETIASYVDTQEPMDKAGAYAIQGIGSTLVEKIEGCYFNVVGLPLHALTQLLQPLGFKLL